MNDNLARKIEAFQTRETPVGNTRSLELVFSKGGPPPAPTSGRKAGIVPNITRVYEFLMSHAEQVMSLDDIVDHLPVGEGRPKLARRPVRSAAGNAVREFANVFRVGEGTYLWSTRKHRQFKDRRGRTCKDCGQVIEGKAQFPENSVYL